MRGKVVALKEKSIKLLESELKQVPQSLPKEQAIKFESSLQFLVDNGINNAHWGDGSDVSSIEAWIYGYFNNGMDLSAEQRQKITRRFIALQIEKSEAQERLDSLL